MAVSLEIESPQDGDTVFLVFSSEGTASIDEDELTSWVTDDNGTRTFGTLRLRFLEQWEFDYTVLAPGPYTLSVKAVYQARGPEILVRHRQITVQVPPVGGGLGGGGAGGS